MKICLVRCPSPFLIDQYVFPPLGLLSVATGLKHRGHDVHIHDGAEEDLPLGFEAYGFGPVIPEYAAALRMKDRIRKNSPGTRIVIGGPYATVDPHACLKDFDCVVTGDGEVESHRAFAGTEKIIHAEERPLDEYPIIDRSLIDLSKYSYLLEGRKTTTVFTSQGCPYRCAFCCKNYKTVRFRSPGHVDPELRAIRDLGYGAVAFPEDLFILRKERTSGICHTLRELDLLWRCLVRADTVVHHGREFARMMAESGCVEVGMGVESGSDRILQNINKGETVSTIRRGIEIMQWAGIRVKGYFIIGLPGEDRGSVEETRRFLREAQLYDVDIKIYQPYPHTPIWNDPESYDVKWETVWDYDAMFYKGRYGEYRGSVSTSGMTTEELYREWVALEKEFKRA